MFFCRSPCIPSYSSLPVSVMRHLSGSTYTGRAIALYYKCQLGFVLHNATPYLQCSLWLQDWSLRLGLNGQLYFSDDPDHIWPKLFPCFDCTFSVLLVGENCSDPSQLTERTGNLAVVAYASLIILSLTFASSRHHWREWAPMQRNSVYAKSSSVSAPDISRVCEHMSGVLKFSLMPLLLWIKISVAVSLRICEHMQATRHCVTNASACVSALIVYNSG